MKHQHRLLVLTAAAVMAVAASVHAAGFVYSTFQTPGDLIFQGDAALLKDRVRLVPRERSKAGGLWYQTKLSVKDGFETTFQFQLTEPGGFGANGIAFV